jgi:hypothetical protein
VQCFRDAPSADGSYSYLLYPLETEGQGWRVAEMTAFRAYNPVTQKCAATPNSPVEADATPVPWNHLEAAAPYPGHEASFLKDETTEAYWSLCRECDRDEGNGAYAVGTTAAQVECIRVTMTGCAVPKHMILRGGLPGNFAGRSDSAGHAGWSQTQLIPTEGKEVVDIPMVCGETDYKYFGEILVNYKRVLTPCQCQQLCIDHIDEGCQAWQWYRELRDCTLLRTVFHPDGRTWLAGTTTEHLSPDGPPGWWRRQRRYPGWVTGLAGPLTTGLERTDHGATFSVTITGVGFPSASMAHAQRIKILLETQDCVQDAPQRTSGGTSARISSPAAQDRVRRRSTTLPSKASSS